MIQKKFLRQADATQLEILVEKNEFCPQGLLLSSVEYNDDEAPFTIAKYEYDSDSRILNKTLTVPPEQEESITYYYNDKGQLSRVTHQFNGEDWKTLEYAYDDQNRLIEVAFFDGEQIEKKERFDHDQSVKKTFEYDEDGDLVIETITQLDASGNEIEEKEIMRTGRSQEVTVTKNNYDDSGNCVRTELYEDDRLVVEEDYFFNDQGVEIKSVGFNHEDGQKTEIFRTVNHQGHVIKEEQFSNGILDFRFIKNYNNEGQLILEQNWALDNGFGEEELLEFVYTYE